MSKLKDYILKNDKKRIALVGANSQGKSHELEELNGDREIKNSVIFIDSETKPDENMKNSSEGATLIDWITQLIGIEKLNTVLDEIITEIDANKTSNGISIKIEKSVSSYKGLIKFNTETSHNRFTSPGSGEKALGQLIMIEKILKNKKSEKYKWLLIDEPETYLHPSMYPLISSTLKSISECGVKVVIATHSPEILKYFIEDLSEVVRMKDGEMYPLKADNYYERLTNNMDIYNNNSLMMDSFKKIKTMSDNYFQSIIKEDIINSVFSEIVILGEGIAEAEIFKYFIKKYPDFYYENNIYAVIIYGKCFIPWYLAIFKEIGIKTLAIYDSDKNKDPKIKHEATNRLIETKSDIAFKIYDNNGIKNDDIEDYLEIKTKDKAKKLITIIREKWLTQDYKLLRFLSEIKEKVELLKNNE